MSGSRSSDFDVQLLFGPPPVLPDVEKQLKDYLLCPDRLPIHDYEKAQQFWTRQPDPSSLYNFELSPLGTTLKVDRDPTTGKLLQFREVEDVGCTYKNSMSLRRAPPPFSESIRGNSSSLPFWPGGFPEISLQDGLEEEAGDINFEDDLLFIAPGFTRGIQFKADGRTPQTEEVKGLSPEPTVSPVQDEHNDEQASAINLLDMVKQEEDLLGLWKENTTETVKDRKQEEEKFLIQSMKIDELEEIKSLPQKIALPILKISKAGKVPPKRTAEWAEELDSNQPVRNFHEKIPRMARKFPFELDDFQKQAILKVEEHCNVFVAAHTSAGKTVVAEYAIALSKEHKTKTVYTSPIKALSNQKFRDFKEAFTDVGLYTGDIQLNPEAGCLIMTTEILRSMLYQGNKIIQDMEFVIFDEVHYINNPERGHVWEEVLILLPEQVCIIMLSATVANTLEFANWVGRTKQKKMYVISTSKRPVPLEHYLYTAVSGKDRNERFLILDGNGRFSKEGYNKARERKEGTKKTTKDYYGPKNPSSYFTQKQELTMWTALLDHLKTNNCLPVIAFTLSRNRCDTNALSLKHCDLNDQKEKHEVGVFYKKCLEKLKDPDKALPQVKNLHDMLLRGIGIHHSGILPILKEIVEMLFQKGLVKLLFATETFAMGVNMPARTVVFDSIRKFNGMTVQTLIPAEYIQMAGRAGRRGTDSVGTVIILCKKEVPKEEDLQTMMMRKPEKLTSQFRLTYSVILRLLKAEGIKMEEMMKFSFMEFDKQLQHGNYAQELHIIKDKIAELSQNNVKGGLTSQLEELYADTSEYLEYWNDIRIKLFFLPHAQKVLIPGRVLLVTHGSHINKLAVLLKIETVRREQKFQVLVLCSSKDCVEPNGEGEISLSLKKTDEKETKPKETKRDEWYKMLGIINSSNIFVPDGIGGHTILTVDATDVIEISTKLLKVNAETIISDWQQRQMPRFRDKEVGPSCKQAIEELTQLSVNSADLFFVNLAKDKIKDVDIISKFKRMEYLKEKIQSYNLSDGPNFEEQFEGVFAMQRLNKKREKLEYLQSKQSMKLYPDYENRKKVLQNLGYITKNNVVELKGNVAIKLRNHELIITELVFRNELTDLPEAEIAALLSCLVFQKSKKDNDEPELIPSLAKGKKAIMEVEDILRREEQRCAVEPIPALNQELCFDLVPVVHEWALGKPFKDIMLLTEVQEGIIVRCIQQLSETLRDVEDAAKVIANPDLANKMKTAQTIIKRDIVFTASLYTC